MTRWSRAVLGALFGAVATLVVHPVSRPFLLGPFVESARILRTHGSSLPGYFPDNLPEPNDALSASLWVHAGSEQVRTSPGLSQAQCEGLAKLARLRGEQDPTNGFWKMSEAVFLHRVGKPQAAIEAWRAASRTLHYDDYQSRYLSNVQSRLAMGSSDQSWQYAYCYRLRSFALSAEIESLARKLASQLDRTTKADLELRYVTLVNGGLLRDGSRSLKVMTRGISIVELASHPRELPTKSSIRRLLIAHSEFKEALKRVGFQEQANEVENQFRENDGWIALTRREDTAEKVQILTLFSALWPNLPGVILQIGLVGFLLTAIGKLIARSIGNRLMSIGIVGAFAVFLIFAAFLLTGSWLALLATSLACGFVLLAPKSMRSSNPQEMGPLFAFSMSILAILLFALTGILFLSRSLPVLASIDSIPEPYQAISDFNMAGGLAAIITAFVYLLAPLWSFALRIKTLFVLSSGLRTLGAIMAVSGLVLATISTPICVYFEKQNAETFRMLMENEPVYYVRQ